MAALRNMQQERAVAVLRQLSNDDDILLIDRIRNTFVAGPTVLLQHLETHRVFDPNDEANERNANDLYRFLEHLITRFEEETENAAEL